MIPGQRDGGREPLAWYIRQHNSPSGELARCEHAVGSLRKIWQLPHLASHTPTLLPEALASVHPPAPIPVQVESSSFLWESKCHGSEGPFIRQRQMTIRKELLRE